MIAEETRIAERRPQVAVVSDEFGLEVVRAARSRIGQGFLSDERRPDDWSIETPFAYGLGPSTGGINCSGLIIRSVSDVLGVEPAQAWRREFRTSRAMVDLLRDSTDYLAGETDFSQAWLADVIFTVTPACNSRASRLIGRHAMIVADRSRSSGPSIDVIHADIDDGVAEQRIFGKIDRIRMPLGVLVGSCVIGSDSQRF